MLPSEDIQAYNYDVCDDPQIAERWTQGDRLTNILLAYLEKHRISKVIEFMAVDAYKNLISWEMVRHATQGNAVHAFSWQYAGSALLPSLGVLTRRMLADWTEDSLLKLKAGDSEPIPRYNDKIVFQRFSVPEAEDLAREIQKQEIRLTYADCMGRMRRNIIQILRSIPSAQDYDHGKGVRAWLDAIEEHKLVEQPICARIREFFTLRNQVEYRGHVMTPAKWENVRRNYETIEKWATEKDRGLRLTLEPIDDRS